MAGGDRRLARGKARMNMTDSDKPTSGRQQHLIDAAWEQVARVRSTAVSGVATAGVGVRTRGGLPDSIPGYRILGEVHRGAQGVVYRAVQESTRRTVAIKVMLYGPFAGPHEKARFQREVEILAQLRHPNIVAIHDSGTAAGATYFVMDYITGLPLDRYITEQRPSLGARLALFAKICEAVNVAHLRGVIHRDLKPGNLRVDESGEPHVLDFGLAKHAVWEAPEEHPTALTMTGQFVGSLPWASPEQAQGKLADLDLRTDVYSLGVILFQLLTGQFPYDVAGSLNNTIESIVKADPRSPRQLNRALDDELSTIVLKALRKEPEARYQTAGALGGDVTRYLNGQPIEAKRESTAYILRKHLKRHRVTATIAAGFLALIFGGLGASLYFWWDAVQARNQEANLKSIAQHNAQLAESRAELAAREAAKARSINDFLIAMLTSASPVAGEGSAITVRAAIAAAVERLARDPFEDPAVEAGIRHAIGQTYATLGELEPAKAQLERALALVRGAKAGELAREMEMRSDYGDVLRRGGDLDAAEAQFELIRTRAGESGTQRDYLNALGTFGLGNVLRLRGKPAEAVALIEPVLPVLRSASAGQPQELATVLNDLALAYGDTGDLDRAFALGREALRINRTVLGADHYTVGVVQSNLAGWHVKRAEFAEAEALYAAALAIFRARVGSEHPSVASLLGALARCKLQRREYGVAEALFEESLGIRKRALGEKHRLIVNSLNNLAIAQFQLGALGKAARSWEAALSLFGETYGAAHPGRAAILTNLGAVRGALGDAERAEAMLREALAVRREAYGRDDLRTCDTAEKLGLVLAEAKSADEGVSLLRSAVAARTEQQGPEHLLTLAARDKLARALLLLGALERAEEEARATLALREPRVEERPLDVADSQYTLGRILLARAGDEAADVNVRGNLLDEAIERFAAARSVLEARFPAEHFKLALLTTDLADALLQTGARAKALLLLERALPTLRAQFGDGDARTARCAALRAEAAGTAGEAVEGL